MKKLLLISCITILSCNFLLAQCNADRHSAKITDQWMSCETSINPNTERGDSHWIMYDFGDDYALNASTIWNCNVYNQTDSGIQNYAVDISNDGETWLAQGEYELSQADASTFYEGEAGPNFNGLVARYVLITSLNGFGGDCACLSEIRFETSGIVSDVVDVPELNLDFEISPNPATDQVLLTILNDKSGFDAEISVLDQTGKLVQKFDQAIEKGNSNIEMNTSALASGNYVVKIQSKEGVLSRKLIIIKDHK